MRKERPSPSLQGELQEGYESALTRTSTRAHYEVAPALVALSRLLVKHRTIAKAIGVSTPFISQLLSGRRECSPKLHEKLLGVLRDAVAVGKQTCDKCERGEMKWGAVAYPAAAIAQIRSRIAEAEAVLRAHPSRTDS